MKILLSILLHNGAQRPKISSPNQQRLLLSTAGALALLLSGCNGDESSEEFAYEEECTITAKEILEIDGKMSDYAFELEVYDDRVDLELYRQEDYTLALTEIYDLCHDIGYRTINIAQYSFTNKSDGSAVTLFQNEGGVTLQGSDDNDVLTVRGVNHRSDAQDIFIDGLSVRTGPGDDEVTGSDSDDNFYGYDGNDILNGGGGKDELHGFQGDDILSGGDGDDEMWGYDGNDTLKGDAGDDLLWGGDGINNLEGGPGVDAAKYSQWSGFYRITKKDVTTYEVVSRHGEYGDEEYVRDTLQHIELVNFNGYVCKLGELSDDYSHLELCDIVTAV